jgi:drug/metabolite transporter (DMT)-like permease
MAVTSIRKTNVIDRASALFVGVAAALWVSDAYFRPALAKQLTASQIVLVEDLLISLCLLPVLLRVRHEVSRLPARKWAALIVIGIGPQALATVLFTRSLTYAFPANAAPDFNVENEVYLLYLLQPVFGIAFARLFLKERGKRYFWPLAAVALAGVYLIVFPDNPTAPFSSLQHAQLVAALLVIGAVALWAAGTVLGRYTLEDVSFLTTSAMRFLIALPVLLVLMLTDSQAHGVTGYSFAQLPSFIGIALIPGVVAMVLYYRALSSTPASMATLAELGYPATFFLVASLGPPVGLGLPFHPIEVGGALLLVAAVTTLNLLKNRDVVEEPRPHELWPVVAAKQPG